MVFGKNALRLVLAASTTLALLTSAPTAAKDVQSFSPDQVIGFAGDSSSIPGAKHFKIVAHDGDEVVAIKIWLPANSDIPPHGKMKEGKAASVLVLSGDLQLAMGDKFDASKLKPMPVGSLIVLTPGNDTHYARTGATPVELLLIQSFAGDFTPRLKVE